MTKSQNTTNEQQKDLCITSEQLTEQWKKGELPEGLYWVKHDGVINILDNLEISLTNVEQVLAPVPSYDELQNMNKAVNECMSANIKLIEQIAQLKELLEWCQDELFEIYSNEVSHPEDVPIIKKLDEVLK